MRTRLVSAAAALLVMSVAVSAYAFPPFSEVKNVCPSCDQGKADVVTLTDGTKIRGKVVAENTSFYTVVRYTEARAIPRTDVQGIEWANGSKPTDLMKHDQILLKNGVVFSGTITDDKDKPALYQLECDFNDFTYIVFKSQVDKVFKQGQET